MHNSDRPILIVIGNYKNGGIARRASLLANGFAGLGKSVTIVVTKKMSENSFFALDNSVQVLDVANNNEKSKKKKEYKLFLKKTFINRKISKSLSRLYKTNNTKKAIINYKASKKRNHFDLAWALSMYQNPIIIALGLEYAADVYGVLSNRRASVIYATRTYAEGELKSIDIELAKAILKSIKCIICQTQYTKDYFTDLGLSKLMVIPNPLVMDISPYAGERSKKIVNFCRISKEKNLEMLITAFCRFHNEHPEYIVEIYGNVINEQEETYKSELLKMISTLHLSDSFKIHPAVNNIHETIQDASMFISTSNYEGLSNSMIEAMALGIPCICTDCDGGGAREMIEDGVNGLIVPKNDPDSLYKAIIRFADNPQFAERCGKAAVTIRERISVENVISKWNDVIEKYC